MAKTAEKERIIVIDGMSYIFRAFYAIQRLSNSKGIPTNAVFGFINMLVKVLEVEKPTKLVIAFDSKGPTFREEKFEGYKANREAPPEDLVSQIPLIMETVDAFNIHRIEKSGFEADDIIGTLSNEAVKEGYRVEIITGDKDLMQLVTDDVTLYDTMKDKRVDEKGVEERFGVKPSQMIDFLALMGDSSDNIPGVSGIGEKTAKDLIQQFGSIEALYTRIDEIKQEKRRNTLLAEKKNAYLSQELATIHCNIPLKLEWKEMDYTGPNNEKLKKLFEELEFHSLMKRFDFKTVDKVKSDYVCVDTEEKLEALVKDLKASKLVAIDTETTALSPHAAKLVGLSFSTKPNVAYYVPIGHFVLGHEEELQRGQLSEGKVKKALQPIFEDEKIAKVGQNLKFDSQILRHWGVSVKGISDDTLIESYLINPDEPHNLDSLAFRYLSHQNITYEEVTGRGRNQINFGEVEISKATQYSAEDADVTFRIHQKLFPELVKNDLVELYRDVELPLIEVLSDMEYQGILVDTKGLKEMSESLLKDITGLEKKIVEHAGEPFNINSPKQLSHILFEKLKLPVIRKTKTGISTDESVLEKLAKEHEICNLIVKFRELSKLRSTYVEGLLAEVDPKTERVHTNYNQTVTATGRLSSSNPNLQNIPMGGGQYDIRAAFIASPGHLFLSADYSQVELRLLAAMSGDKELMRAFENDEDVHEFTAGLIFGVKTVTSEQRKIAKTINFGVMYGQTPFGLSQTLGITPKEAKEFIDTYFVRYSGVKKFMDGLIKNARSNGYAETLLGRRRYLPELNSQNRMRREMAERAAINAPIQGTAADMIKRAMVSLYKKLKDEKLKSRMLLQVHDELVVEVSEGEKSRVEEMVVHEMESALDLKVKLKVDVGWGKNWRECS